jgi:hypothetical protein
MSEYERQDTTLDLRRFMDFTKPKVSDIENQNRQISLYPELPPEIVRMAIDEADNNLGIKTDKKLVEYPQDAVYKMNRRNVNLWNAILDDKVDLNLSPIPKPKSELQEALEKIMNKYEKSPVKPKDFNVSKDGFNIKVKGNIPSLKKSPPDDDKR